MGRRDPYENNVAFITGVVVAEITGSILLGTW